MYFCTPVNNNTKIVFVLIFLFLNHTLKIKIMKKLLISGMMLLAFNSVKAQKVYATKYESLADVKVYVTKYEGLADLIVYKMKNESLATGNRGKWFFMKNESLAKKKIYFTKYEGLADLKIYYTKYEGLAGWRNTSKKGLME